MIVFRSGAVAASYCQGCDLCWLLEDGSTDFRGVWVQCHSKCFASELVYVLLLLRPLQMGEGGHQQHHSGAKQDREAGAKGCLRWVVLCHESLSPLHTTRGGV